MGGGPIPLRAIIISVVCENWCATFFGAVWWYICTCLCQYIYMYVRKQDSVYKNPRSAL